MDMVRIVERKRYDTANALKVGSASGGGYPTDFGYWEEELYRTATYAWFIVGEGGPSSPYATATDGQGGMRGGSDLRPVSPGEAYEWLERHEFLDEIAECFPRMVEDA